MVLISALHGSLGRLASSLRYQAIGIQKKEEGDKKMVDKKMDRIVKRVQLISTFHVLTPSQDSLRLNSPFINKPEFPPQWP